MKNEPLPLPVPVSRAAPPGRLFRHDSDLHGEMEAGDPHHTLTASMIPFAERLLAASCAIPPGPGLLTALLEVV